MGGVRRRRLNPKDREVHPEQLGTSTSRKALAFLPDSQRRPPAYSPSRDQSLWDTECSQTNDPENSLPFQQSAVPVPLDICLLTPWRLRVRSVRSRSVPSFANTTKPKGAATPIEDHGYDNATQSALGRLGPMSFLDERGRPEPPVAGNDTATLLGALDRQRAYLAWKCGGVDSKGLTKTIASSSITLGGLLKHLALIEDYTFGHKFSGLPLGPPWGDVDFDSDPDWEWHTASADSPDDLMMLWKEAVSRSRAIVAAALASGRDFDQPGRTTFPDGRTPTLRRYMIDMIEEYARHVGHADLIRESVDGLVGEDPEGGLLAV